MNTHTKKESEQHTAENTFSELKLVTDELKTFGVKVQALTRDNENKMKSVGEMFESDTKNPHFGDGAHAQDLIVKAIITNDSNDSGNRGDFEWSKKICDQAKEMLQTFRVIFSFFFVTNCMHFFFLNVKMCSETKKNTCNTCVMIYFCAKPQLLCVCTKKTNQKNTRAKQYLKDQINNVESLSEDLQEIYYLIDHDEKENSENNQRFVSRLGVPNPVITRWQSHKRGFEFLLKYKQRIRELTVNEEASHYVCDEVKSYAVSTNFWKELSDLIVIITPFCEAIESLSKDFINSGEVLHIWNKCYEKVEKMTFETLNDRKTKKIKQALEYELNGKWNLIFHTAHSGVYLVDPKYSRIPLSYEDEVNGMEFLKQYAGFNYFFDDICFIFLFFITKKLNM